MSSYMAVTAHYIHRSTPESTAVLRTQLVAFRLLKDSHSGENLAKAFIQILKEINCLHKVRWLQSVEVAARLTLILCPIDLHDYDGQR